MTGVPPREKGTPLPLPSLHELCAELDVGGGVAYGGTFLIYTQQQYRKYSPVDLLESDIYSKLLDAAKLVSSSLQTYFSTDNLHTEELHGLPTNGPELWFFLNASHRKPANIGIAGRDSVVHTLLSLLQRPWCIMELCCTATSSIRALHTFASVARILDPTTYTLAKLLLHHEMGCRESTSLRLRRASSPSSTLSKTSLHNHRRLVQLSTALFPLSESSYSPFWIRAICMCAFRLHLSISVMGSFLYFAYTQHSRGQLERNFWLEAVFRQFGDTWSTMDEREQGACVNLFKQMTISWMGESSGGSLAILYGEIMKEIAQLAVP